MVVTSVVAQNPAYSEPTKVSDQEDRWAFRPVKSTVVPTPRLVEWARGPVDRFLLAAMEAKGLRPGVISEAAVLVRRLHYDLTGLPPSPAVISKFEANPSDAAYQQLVERLIASPQFGERWGRHWLDVARFAESSGGGRSLMFKNAWRFRDYVIDHFNADRPFNDFIREQVAGDLLDAKSDAQRNRQLVGTGFLELGPTNYEQQDKQLLRMDVIDEQIDTIGRVFMGMTLGCARCHDHKFDPVPIEDYYALAGILGSTQILTPGNVSGYVEQELRSQHAQVYKAHRKRERLVETELKKLRKVIKQSDSQHANSKLGSVVLDDAVAEKLGKWVASTHVAGFLGKGYIHDGNTAKGDKSARFVFDVPKSGDYDLELISTSGPSRATNVPVRVLHATGETQAFVNQRSEKVSRRIFSSVGRFRLVSDQPVSVTIETSGTDGHVVVDGLRWSPVDRSAVDPEKARLAATVDRQRARQTRLEQELSGLKKSVPPAPMKAMAVRDTAKPADGRVHLRGMVRSLGGVVPRGFLSVCGKSRPQIPKGESGRRQLADWLADPAHPLTARVYVNRIWHYLFGVGLVHTPDNFGKMGGRPSHPKLLDWLAAHFVRQGWSTKSLVRELVVSSAYRLRTGESSSLDPDNRLLTHANRRRLDAESLRDSVLWVSGQLDPKMGGSTIRKYSTYDYGYAFKSNRRSLYVPRFRGIRLEIFDVFDAADPNLVTGRRATSQVSTQALYLMNNPWLMNQADHAAKRLLQNVDQNLDQLLDRAYILSLGRLPAPEERRLAVAFLTQFPVTERPKAWGQLFHTLFACLDFRYLD